MDFLGEPEEPQLIDREPREGLLMGIDWETDELNLEVHKGTHFLKFHNGLLAFTNRETILPKMQEKIAKEQAKKNLPPNKYELVLARNNPIYYY